MNMQAVKRAVFATVSAGALLAALGAIPAAATPTFTINPNGIPGVTFAYTPKTETTLILTSDSLVRQTGPSTQTETGWALAEQFKNDGVPSSATGLAPEDNSGAPPFPFNLIPGSSYGLYFTYNADVSGISGFGAGQNGTITSFTYKLFADVGDNDIFNPGSAATVAGTNPSVTDTSANDIVLAVGNSLSGSAGFQAATGAPIFSTVNNFILCNGTTDQGFLGGALITGGAATGCGTFNAASYFTAPSPFYSVAFVSATADRAPAPSAFGPGGVTLNGIAAAVSFDVPEPLTLSLFGAGLAGIAVMRRRKKAA